MVSDPHIPPVPVVQIAVMHGLTLLLQPAFEFVVHLLYSLQSVVAVHPFIASSSAIVVIPFG